MNTVAVPIQCKAVKALSNIHTEIKIEKNFLRVRMHVIVKLENWLDSLEILLAQKYWQLMFPTR